MTSLIQFRRSNVFLNQSEALTIGRHDKTRAGVSYSGVGLFCLDSLLLSHQGERRNKGLNWFIF